MQYLKTNWHPTPNQTKPNQTRFDDTMIPNWYRKTSYRDIRTANKFNYQSNPKAKTIWTHLNRYLLESLGSHWEAQVSNGEPSIGDKLLTSPTSPTSHVASPRIFRPPLSEQKSRFFIVFFSSCLRVKRDQGRRRGSEISKVWLLSLTTHQINSERLAIRVDMSSLAASLVTGVGLRPERPILYQPTSFPSSR